MAEQFTQPDKPLAEYSKAELFEMADQRKIRGRYDMSKAQLVEALEESLTAPEGQSGDEPESGPDAPELGESDEPIGDGAESGEDARETLPPSDPSDTEPPLEGEPLNTLPPSAAVPAIADIVAAHNLSHEGDALKLREQERQDLEAELLRQAEAREASARESERAESERKATAAAAAEKQRAANRAAAHAQGLLLDEDREAILAASESDLQDMLGDKVNPPPGFIAAALQAELNRRQRIRENAAAKRRMQSDISQYRITRGTAKDMRYVTPTGYFTQLPVGALISDLSHDLNHVAQQGFEWEPVRSVELGEDQMGVQLSKPVAGA